MKLERSEKIITHFSVTLKKSVCEHQLVGWAHWKSELARSPKLMIEGLGSCILALASKK